MAVRHKTLANAGFVSNFFLDFGCCFFSLLFFWSASLVRVRESWDVNSLREVRCFTVRRDIAPLL